MMEEGKWNTKALPAVKQNQRLSCVLCTELANQKKQENSHNLVCCTLQNDQQSSIFCLDVTYLDLLVFTSSSKLTVILDCIQYIIINH